MDTQEIDLSMETQMDNDNIADDVVIELPAEMTTEITFQEEPTKEPQQSQYGSRTVNGQTEYLTPFNNTVIYTDTLFNNVIAQLVDRAQLIPYDNNTETDLAAVAEYITPNVVIFGTVSKKQTEAFFERGFQNVSIFKRDEFECVKAIMLNQSKTPEQTPEQWDIDNAKIQAAVAAASKEAARLNINLLTLLRSARLFALDNFYEYVEIIPGLTTNYIAELMLTATGPYESRVVTKQQAADFCTALKLRNVSISHTIKELCAGYRGYDICNEMIAMGRYTQQAHEALAFKRVSDAPIFDKIMYIMTPDLISEVIHAVSVHPRAAECDYVCGVSIRDDRYWVSVIKSQGEQSSGAASAQVFLSAYTEAIGTPTFAVGELPITTSMPFFRT